MQTTSDNDTIAIRQRPAESHVQAHLSDHIRVVTSDATASTYGPLTDIMGGRVITGC